MFISIIIELNYGKSNNSKQNTSYLFSILLSSAFENTVGRVGIPYFALPFCTIATCTFFSIKPESTSTLVSNDSTFENNDFEIEDFNNQTDIDVDWCKFGQGVLLSMGQVYAINDFRTSTIMNIAVFLASPLLFITSTIGALFGSLAGKLKAHNVEILLFSCHSAFT